MKNVLFKRIMIFGRPGSGKSTFATWLSKSFNIPLHHLDKHFYSHNWVERDYNEFLQIQRNIVSTECWIIDGNSTRSLEIRWAQADLILYFNFPKCVCTYRIFKRFVNPHQSFDGRPPGCEEKISLKFLKYMWKFDKRVATTIKNLQERYPKPVFQEIRCARDLAHLLKKINA